MSKKVSSYTVLEASSVEDLIDIVRKKITECWEPLGGVQTVESNGKINFYQSMIFYSKKKLVYIS